MNSSRKLALFLTAVGLSLLGLGCSVSFGGPSDAEKRNNSGLALQEEGRFEEAIVEFDEALRLDPDAALVYYNRGVAYIGLGQQGRAIEDFDETLRPTFKPP